MANRKAPRTTKGAMVKDAATPVNVQLVKRDTLTSVLAGFGQGKAAATSFTNGTMLAEKELTAMFDFNWLAKKIVTKPVNDALRPGIEISADANDDLALYLRTRWYELDVINKMKEAKWWARLYGGGALVLIVEENKATDPWRPLVPSNIKRIIDINVADAFELQPARWYDDPLKPKFGLPATYHYLPMSEGTSAPQVTIHESRVIRFNGEPRPSRSVSGLTLSQWGCPILQNIYDEIMANAIFEDCTTELASDFVTRVLKMTGLVDLVANKQDEQIRRRVSLLSKNLTPHRTAVIDQSEDLTKTQSPIAGYADLINYFADIVAGASGIPRAILFSQQLGTLAGAEETKGDYHDLLLDLQEGCTKQVDELLAMFLLEDACPEATADDYEWTWNSLTSKNEKTEAEARKIQADIDVAYITQGVVTADEVRESRFGSGEYSFTTVIEEEDEDLLAQEEEAMVEMESTTAPADTSVTDAKREAQTYIVPKALAKTVDEAAKIVKAMGGKVTTSRETGESWRFRQRPPEKFVAGSFKTFEVPQSKGVVIIFGSLKGKE